MKLLLYISVVMVFFGCDDSKRLKEEMIIGEWELIQDTEGNISDTIRGIGGWRHFYKFDESGKWYFDRYEQCALPEYGSSKKPCYPWQLASEVINGYFSIGFWKITEDGLLNYNYDGINDLGNYDISKNGDTLILVGGVPETTQKWISIKTNAKVIR